MKSGCRGSHRSFMFGEYGLVTLTIFRFNGTFNKLRKGSFTQFEKQVRIPYSEDLCFYRAKGCGACHETGYAGRTGIHEFLVMNEALKKLVLETADANQIRNLARSQGMKTLLQNGADKVIAGQTTIEEVYRVAQS